MPVSRVAATLIAVVAVATSIAAMPQVRPDFSGRWTTDPAPAAADSSRAGGAGNPATAGRGTGGGGRSGDMGTGWGSTITVVQDAAKLTVEYAFFGRGDMQPPLKFSYALDGSETTQTVMMGRGMQRQSSKTAWDANTLVITTTHAFQDPVTGKPSPATVTHRLTLESPASLVVEVTRSGVMGGPASTVRSVYRRITS
jgi:hypothetical protein